MAGQLIHSQNGGDAAQNNLQARRCNVGTK